MEFKWFKNAAFLVDKFGKPSECDEDADYLKAIQEAMPEEGDDDLL
jgi:hypothetical protein